MDRSPILLLVMIGLFLAVVIVVYSSLMGTLAVTERVFSSSDSINPLKKNSLPGYFNINALRYYDRALVESQQNSTGSAIDRCAMNLSKEVLIIDMTYNYQRKPENCNVFVDNLLEKTFVIGELPDAMNRSDNSILQPVVVDKVNIYESHLVKLCCENVCHEDVIGPLCTR
ncbi:hypothetical protein JXB31_03085 [Candidatus Woesearchaeota archaeon]|nr:hypothetical protein [Candidatus Woesearchaeota archaeon]